MSYSTTIIRSSQLLNHGKVNGKGLKFTRSHKYYSQNTGEEPANTNWESGAVLRSRFIDEASMAHAYCDDQFISHGLNVTNTKYWAKTVLNTILKIYGEEYLEYVLKSFANSSRQFHRSGVAEIVEQRCPKIQCPTLVLHGSKNPIVPTRHAQYFFENIKNCQVHLIPGAGHNLHLTHSDEFLSLVDAFLQISK